MELTELHGRLQVKYARLMQMKRHRLREEIEEYDRENSTELLRFVNFLERGKVIGNGESKFFHISNTGDLLQKYGMNGKITIGVSVFNNRHSKNGHNLDVSNWVSAIKSINSPIAISKYLNGKNSYRVYTATILDGKSVCMGMDIHSTGRNVEVINITTAFWRDISKIGQSETEELLYVQAQKKTDEQSSSAHNPQIYPQQSFPGCYPVREKLHCKTNTIILTGKQKSKKITKK